MIRELKNIQLLQLLLKSAMAVSRTSKAYQLSFNQSKESHVMLYNVYIGKADDTCLGKLLFYFFAI